MSFGENLRHCRKELGLNQRQLAEALGVSHSLVAQMETGRKKPSFETLCAVGEYFHISISDLVGSEELPDDKTRLLDAWDKADPVYRGIALELLTSHPAQE